MLPESISQIVRYRSETSSLHSRVSHRPKSQLTGKKELIRFRKIVRTAANFEPRNPPQPRRKLEELKSSKAGDVEYYCWQKSQSKLADCLKPAGETITHQFPTYSSSLIGESTG